MTGYLIGGALLWVALGATTAWILEWIEWNGGVCAATGERWRYFDTDSQGGRGYSSSARTIWISYPWIDRKEGQ